MVNSDMAKGNATDNEAKFVAAQDADVQSRDVRDGAGCDPNGRGKPGSGDIPTGAVPVFLASS